MGSPRSMSLLGLGRQQKGQRYSKYEARKFLLTSSAPALIQPEETDEFIDFIVNESELFGEATVDRMDTNEKDIRFIDMTGGILRKASCPAGPAVTHQATESANISNWNKCLRTMTLDAKFYLCDDDLQDNLTGAELEQQVQRMATDTIANEMDFIALMGNVSGHYSNAAMVNSDVLHLRDGWYRQLQFGNILSAGAVDPADLTLSFHKLNCLGRAIPTKYRKNLASFRIYMPSDMWWDYAELHQGRETSLGDDAHLGPLTARHLTTPIRPIALMPTDLSRTACSSNATSDRTFMFMTQPANLVVGIEQNVEFERERWAMQSITWFKWKVRFDMLVFNEEATSMVDDMTLMPCGPGTCYPYTSGRTCWDCLDEGSGPDD